jgi:hypothetical protein
MWNKEGRGEKKVNVKCCQTPEWISIETWFQFVAGAVNFLFVTTSHRLSASPNLRQKGYRGPFDGIEVWSSAIVECLFALIPLGPIYLRSVFYILGINTLYRPQKSEIQADEGIMSVMSLHEQASYLNTHTKYLFIQLNKHQKIFKELIEIDEMST